MKSVPLGLILVTPGAKNALDGSRLAARLNRHRSGDWGIVDAEDWEANDQALVEGTRVLSAYPIDPARPSEGHGENTLWIITEADRSSTTLLLPEEY